MGFPKVFERPVGAPPDAAYSIVMAWLGEIRAKVTENTPPRHVKAQWGKAMRLADQTNARKIMIIDIAPIQGGSLVRVTMPIYWGYKDDALFNEVGIHDAWLGFLRPLWVHLGYPPGSV